MATRKKRIAVGRSGGRRPEEGDYVLVYGGIGTKGFVVTHPYALEKMAIAEAKGLSRPGSYGGEVRVAQLRGGRMREVGTAVRGTYIAVGSKWTVGDEHRWWSEKNLDEDDDSPRKGRAGGRKPLVYDPPQPPARPRTPLVYDPPARPRTPLVYDPPSPRPRKPLVYVPPRGYSAGGPKGVSQILDERRAKAEQGAWIPASGGTEKPFRTRSGKILQYLYQPSSGRHAYYDVGSDLILSDEDAWAYLGMANRPRR